MDTVDLARDEKVRAALQELTNLIRWINERYAIPLPADPRGRMANGCFDAALEHQAAIQLLATDSSVPTLNEATRLSH